MKTCHEKPMIKIELNKSIDFSEIKKWNEQGKSLKDELNEYTWYYIKKTCSQCSVIHEITFSKAMPFISNRDIEVICLSVIPQGVM